MAKSADTSDAKEESLTAQEKDTNPAMLEINVPSANFTAAGKTLSLQYTEALAIYSFLRRAHRKLSFCQACYSDHASQELGGDNPQPCAMMLLLGQ